MADALVKLLNRYGYQPVFLPRTGVTPPELYTFVDHRLVRRGPLGRYFPRTVGFEVRSGRLADIEGRVTSAKDHAAGVSFLKSAFAALGVTGLPRVDLSFTGTNALSFAFSGVEHRGIDPSDLDAVLPELTLPASIPDRDVEEGALHIAFEYAYARTLILRRADGKAFTTDLGGGIGDWVDLGTKLHAEVRGGASVSFTAAGETPAAFAYKAGRLQRIGTRWLFAPEVVSRGPGAAPARPYLPAEREVLRAEEE